MSCRNRAARDVIVRHVQNKYPVCVYVRKGVYCAAKHREAETEAKQRWHEPEPETEKQR